MVWIFLTSTLAVFLGFMFWASASIRSGVYLKAFCGERTDEKVVYLTFDDGPVAETTPKVLDVLEKRGAKATFFMIGANVSGNEQIVRRVLSDGHGIGIHSYSHSGTFPLYGMERMADDVTECGKLLDGIAGRHISLFRPPFGVVNPTVAAVVRRCGLVTVGWNVRSFDTMGCGSPDWAEKVLRRIMRKVRPGSVILLHDRLPEADVLLSRLLDRLSAEGYRFDRQLPC